MFSLRALRKAAMAAMMIGCLAGAARADPISITVPYTSGVSGTSGYLNASVEITVLSGGVVEFRVTNLLSSGEVWSVGQNISGLYFTVNGAGSGSLTDSYASAATWINAPKGATPVANYEAGPINPTGWILTSDGNGSFALCVICSPSNPPRGPTSTIIGGSGTGNYIHANGSLDNNTAHNPFLVSDVVFTMNIDGVTSPYQITNVTFQFGTTATPPTAVPDGSALSLLFLSGVSVAGMIMRRRI